MERNTEALMRRLLETANANNAKNDFNGMHGYG